MMKEIILQKVHDIEEKENIEILFAAESGSRAWGFASPDSDYDVRFIYVRRPEDYLRLEPQRDVIEWQLDDVLDINGWDIRKVLQLLYKSNPSVFEWSNSPIVYKRSEKFKQVEQLLPAFFSVKKSIYHYWHMADSIRKDYMTTSVVKLKKYFYAIRPILAAQWVLENRSAPPIQFSELVFAELPEDLRIQIEMMLEQKKTDSELGVAPRIPVLDQYIESKLDELKEKADEIEENRDDKWDELNKCFLNLIYP